MTSLAQCRKRFERVYQKRCNNVHFDELCSLLEIHGWELRTVAKKNHYIYVHEAYEGIVNIPKPHKGGDVKRKYCRDALRAIEEVAGYE